MILLCIKTLYPIHGFHSPFRSKMCIPLLVRCHCPPIWSLALPLNLIYIWTVLSKLSLGSPPYTNSTGCVIRKQKEYDILHKTLREMALLVRRGSRWNGSEGHGDTGTRGHRDTGKRGQGVKGTREHGPWLELGWRAVSAVGNELNTSVPDCFGKTQNQRWSISWVPQLSKLASPMTEY
jgi:hypothetical protein